MIIGRGIESLWVLTIEGCYEIRKPLYWPIWVYIIWSLLIVIKIFIVVYREFLIKRKSIVLAGVLTLISGCPISGVLTFFIKDKSNNNDALLENASA